MTNHAELALSDIDCIWPLGADLGEGPVWSVAEQALYFVDIHGRGVHRFCPGTGAKTDWTAPKRTGFIVPMAAGGFLCGMEDGLRPFDPETGTFGDVQPVEPLLHENRLNDGYVGPDGALWFGTMHDPEEEDTGTLYRLGRPGEEPVAMDRGYTVTNGPVIDPARGRLYHNDSPRRRIYAFDLVADGTLSNKRLFAEPSRGYPDGMALDGDGRLWVALWDGAGVECFAPDGTRLGIVPIPSPNVTKICFGDADFRTAYVTTARRGASDEALAAMPEAGGIFRFRVGVAGVPSALFGS